MTKHFSKKKERNKYNFSMSQQAQLFKSGSVSYSSPLLYIIEDPKYYYHKDFDMLCL